MPLETILTRNQQMVLDVLRSSRTPLSAYTVLDRLDGGLQHAPTTLLAGQSHAQRVRHQIGTGKAGRIGPNINPRTLPKAGGNLGLRSPLTACWSTGARKRHAYYLCPKRGCESYGKSIRKDQIEGDFEALLQSLTPTENVVRVASRLFKDLRDKRVANAVAERAALKEKLTTIEREVGRLLTLVVDANLPSVIAAYEQRIGLFENEKLLIREKIQRSEQPKASFDDTL